MRSHTAMVVALCTAAFGVPDLKAQVRSSAADETRATDVRLYLRAVAREFGVQGRELEVLDAWVEHRAELPVLLFVADRAGVMPDVVGSLRKQGQSWQRIALRFGLGPAAFRVPLEASAAEGILARPLVEFARPPGEWHLIAMTDLEIIALVNVRVLSNQLGTPPERLLPEIGTLSPDFIGAYARVLRARTAAEPPPP